MRIGKPVNLPVQGYAFLNSGRVGVHVFALYKIGHHIAHQEFIVGAAQVCMGQEIHETKIRAIFMQADFYICGMTSIPASDYSGPLHYKITGEGPAVVLLHGFCESSSIWDALVPQLPGYSCIQVDAAGFGSSAVPPGFDFSMRSQAQLVLDLLSYLGITQAVWIGHSMGGYIALEALSLQPEAVQGLVLFHSTAAPDAPERKENRNKTIRIVAETPDLFIREFYFNLFAPGLKAFFVPEIAHFRRQAALLDPQVIIHTLEGLRDRQDHRETLQRYLLPKHYIIGQNDQILPAAELKIQAEQCGAGYTWLEKAGHMGFLEEPEPVATAIRRFLAETILV